MKERKKCKKLNINFNVNIIIYININITTNLTSNVNIKMHRIASRGLNIPRVDETFGHP